MKDYAMNRGTLITTYNYEKMIEIDSKTVVEKVDKPLKLSSKEKGYQNVKVNIKEGRK